MRPFNKIAVSRGVLIGLFLAAPTAPNGVSCLLIAGKYWRNVVIKARDLKL